MVLGDGVAAEVDAVVVLHQRDIEEALFSGFMGLQFGFELFVDLDPFLAVAMGFDQGIGIAALPIMTLSEGFENVHGCSWVRLCTDVLLTRPQSLISRSVCTLSICIEL